MKSKPFDLLIPTYYNPYFLEIFQKKPFVLTVYDMIHELYPHCFKKEDKTSEWKQTLIPKATKIIAISESTKSDLIRFYPTVNPDDIHVVYLSYSAMNSQVKVPNLPKKYVLFIGNREHYKNFKFFAESMKSLLDKYSDLTVLCAGGATFNEEEITLFKALGHENKFIQYNFKDNELAHIYQKAECFVFPSEYEGFGIPVLEAMANSCPCILARHSSFPEVAGEAGIYFELNNGIDLSDKIELTINDHQFRQGMVEKGLENLKRFSWEKTARACVEVYDLAIKKSLTAL
jgi:glycosyltransferase involved in cell wall biosynthesis